MITFDTQADFDEAVIDAIAKLLEMRVAFDRYGNRSGAELELAVSLIRKDDERQMVLYDSDKVNT